MRVCACVRFGESFVDGREVGIVRGIRSLFFVLSNVLCQQKHQLLPDTKKKILRSVRLERGSRGLKYRRSLLHIRTENTLFHEVWNRASIVKI